MKKLLLAMTTLALVGFSWLNAIHLNRWRIRYL
jgi:hypothetical protein